MKRIVLFAVLLLGCSASSPRGCEPPDQGTIEAVVVSIGWHTGIALPVEAINRELIPETADFPKARYLEFGFGEEDFYMADDPSLWLGLRDLLWPHRGAMQVTPISAELPRFFEGATFVFLALAPARFEGLQRYLGASFRRAEGAKAPVLGLGHYPGSRFYSAERRFSVGHTCNTWVAGGLRAAGYPISSPLPITASGLLLRAGEFGCLAGSDRGERSSQK